MADHDFVDVVDDEDNVLGVTTRAEIRRAGLRHRAVYIVVRTTDDRVVVHRRADWKDVYPGAWDICFGGVLDVGEDWDAAARRELAEEAGITGDLAYLGRGTYDEAPSEAGPGTGINGRVYEIIHDGPYPCPDGEVTEIDLIPRAELPAFVSTHPMINDSPIVVLPYLVD